MATKHIETKFGEVTHERQALPFIGEVIDLSYADMLKFRIAVRERCVTDPEYRNAIYQMCAMDCAFFAAVFAVFHETRATEEKQGAFPVWLDPDQADILACFQRYGGVQDMAVEKSRGIGLSFLACVYALWVWMFREGGKIEVGILSKDEDSLDTPRRPSSLMGKLDLLFDSLPAWMKMLNAKKTILHRTIGDHKFENLKNGNAILGYVPTNDKLRSARLFCLLSDEAAFLPFETQRWLAAAHGTTPSIIYISTHDGTSSVFYRLTQNKTADLIRMSTWWNENRRCRRGLYRSVAGQIEIIDKTYKFMDYPFSHEHAPLLRSPWVDRQFNRPEANPATVLQELYGVAVINMKKLFQAPVIAIAKKTQRAPVWRGTINAKGQFLEMFENAPVYAFKPIDMLGNRFVIGADPANGVPGGAYAGVSVVEVNTGEQVLSGLFTNTDPTELAQICVALSKYLGSLREGSRGIARIAYECTGGVGSVFEKELLRLKFPEAMTLLYHNRDRGEGCLMEMGRALRDGDLVLRDNRVAQELEGFSYERNMILEYTGRDGHGDGTIGLGIAWQQAKELRRPALQRAARNPNSGENEPDILEARRNSGTWSSQFSDPY